jgi:hypothetical protein
MSDYDLMGERELVLDCLKKLEKKHKAFFKKAKLKIKDCVVLKGLHNISILVVNDHLPANIKHDIETLFCDE